MLALQRIYPQETVYKAYMQGCKWSGRKSAHQSSGPLVVASSSDALVEQVIEALQDPRRRVIAGADPLIIKFVELYCAQHDMSPTKGQYVRGTLNTLIGTVVKFREITRNPSAGVKNMLQPITFGLAVIEAAKSVAGFAEEGKVAAPLHASTIRRALNE